MKGITPIISIIILLLITVGLAAAAWTYMGNYLTTLTAKSIEIPTQKCIGGDAMAVIHNMGTATITLANDVTVWNDQGNVVPDASISWEDLSGAVITQIEAGKYGKVEITCCAADCPKTCSFDLIIAGRTNTITTYCP
ncbi:MAG: hypothetical protein JSV39_02405 [Candidatus Aenigmatarchaeota archaeon]|nr:MAG: hypothetical protein JSV39_02405 [Candidatus Aenigmarchaeota archaeon]